MDNNTVVINSFEEMGLKEELLRGVFGYGFETPSVIQERAIPAILTRRDVIAQAQSGTGKTGTFTISALQRIDENKPYVQCIILAHTHELAHQIKGVIDQISEYMKNIKTCLCIGGTLISDSIKEIKSGAQIIIGTPGRVLHMIQKSFVKKSNIEMLIMDEADELLSGSFQEQIKDIIKTGTDSESQICIFSATLPKDKLDLTLHFMNKPLTILVKKEQLTLEGISQFYDYIERDEYKFDYLCHIYDRISISQSIIYVNTVKKASLLAEKLHEKNFTVTVIHGNMPSHERTEVMKQFRNGTSRILISTDLLARGIDVQQVSIVINYDIPTNRESYIHRIGRSGRYGRKGVAINFVTRRDTDKMRELEEFYNTQIVEIPENIGSYL
tara:strand:+ start:4986 stop:6140 length:1155 start_codon:yes stop_codon:yes gene_type:complete